MRASPPGTLGARVATINSLRQAEGGTSPEGARDRTWARPFLVTGGGQVGHCI
jgi:hypothetical protein